MGDTDVSDHHPPHPSACAHTHTHTAFWGLCVNCPHRPIFSYTDNTDNRDNYTKHSLWGLHLNKIYRGVKTSTNQLNKFALWNPKTMSHKPECPHKVEEKLTPVPTNQSMQEHTQTHTHTHTHTHTRTHTLKSLLFVFNKVHFIIDRDLSKQF